MDPKNHDFLLISFAKGLFSGAMSVFWGWRQPKTPEEEMSWGFWMPRAADEGFLIKSSPKWKDKTLKNMIKHNKDVISFSMTTKYLWTPKPWKMKVLGPQYMGYNP